MTNIVRQYDDLTDINDNRVAEDLSRIYNAGNLARRSRILSANTTLDTKDAHVQVNTNSGNVTITLPNANSWNVGSETKATILVIENTGTNVVTLALATGDSMTGPTTIPAGSSAFLTNDGVVKWSHIRLAYSEGTWTPVVTSGGGTITTYSASGRWTKIGRLVYFEVIITITTNGTANTYLLYTLAHTAAQASAFSVSTEAGIACSTRVTAASNQPILRKYDATYPGADGVIFYISGFYEV